MAARRGFPETMPGGRQVAIGALVVLAHVALLVPIVARRPHVAPSSAPSWGEPGANEALVSLARLPSPRPIETRETPKRAAAQSAPAKSDPVKPQPAREAPAAETQIAHPESLDLPPPRSDIAPTQVGGAPEPAIIASASALPVATDACGLAGLLRGALQADPRVGAALALVPRPSRSVANAIMLWDGQWIAVTSPVGDAGIEPIRAAIVEALRTASPECQTMVNSGPILVSITDAFGPTILALGSGVWRAADIVMQGPPSK